MIILYSTNCPLCRTLERKLNSKKIEYEKCHDLEKMKSLDFKSVPVLDVDGQIMTFSEAIKWVNTIK